VDAEENQLERWYIERFIKFRRLAVNDPTSYFYNFIHLTDDDAKHMAQNIWREINRKNLRKNILPTRERASLILHKEKQHQIDFVRLRK
jgi:type I pantothenate kinase